MTTSVSNESINTITPTNEALADTSASTFGEHTEQWGENIQTFGNPGTGVSNESINTITPVNEATN